MERLKDVGLAAFLYMVVEDDIPGHLGALL
jgi:hypothetical protein